ncbi:methyltransferase domain-containing protein [Sulfurimonas sp. NWX79]|uniref:methyltransferase domain-containing protein n=1 Tax=Sulfurimonas sp. NWX79 TaxID=2925412 RepID=UPI003204B63B
MGFEASKTKEILTDWEKNLLSGDGIDIGCGLDPIMPTARAFDIDDGDANCITQYVDKQYDYVFSSHCLEHMHNPQEALNEWWKIVKSGGHLIFTVPDEDLYEQGYFPSLFNDDHKSTFTISKRKSWSDKSYNLLDLVSSLPESTLIKIELQDLDYDRSSLYHSVYSRNTAHFGMNMARKIASAFQIFGIRKQVYLAISHLFRLPIDQSHNNALAQIFVIVKKN